LVLANLIRNSAEADIPRGLDSSFPYKRLHSLLERAVCSERKAVFRGEVGDSATDDLPERTLIHVMGGRDYVAHKFCLISFAAPRSPHLDWGMKNTRGAVLLQLYRSDA
jgi:hypothetical protein